MKFKKTLPAIKEIESQKQFKAQKKTLTNCSIQAIDFSTSKIDWAAYTIKNTTFMGCQLNIEDEVLLRRKGATIFSRPSNLPYSPFRKTLYHWKELMEGYSVTKDKSVDFKIYKHFSKKKYDPPITEALYQRVHDHAIDDALRDLLQYNDAGMTKKKCVGFMGGHGTLRTDPFFKKTAETARLLAAKGYLVVSGGGPGIMEATNLGAYFANYPQKALEEALKTLCKAPHYSDKNFQAQAMKVLKKYPKGKDSLAIPTWFYGHEPSNLFASHIAKYFSNSIREDTLLAICLHGIVYAPGSAGTTQEIFMEATQNHYGTFNYYSPMVFLGRHRYEIETMLYPALKQLSYGRKYHDLLFISDEPREILDFIKKHPPVKT